MLCSLGLAGCGQTDHDTWMTNTQGHSRRTNHSVVRVALGDQGRNEKRLERTAFVCLLLDNLQAVTL